MSRKICGGFGLPMRCEGLENRFDPVRDPCAVGVANGTSFRKAMKKSLTGLTAVYSTIILFGLI